MNGNKTKNKIETKKKLVFLEQIYCVTTHNEPIKWKEKKKPQYSLRLL